MKIFLDGMDTAIVVILRARERKRAPIYSGQETRTRQETQPRQEKAKDRAQN